MCIGDNYLDSHRWYIGMHRLEIIERVVSKTSSPITYPLLPIAYHLLPVPLPPDR
ncbi:hypothetical protein DBB_15500 [Desulfoluna spongiiphila]|nr:hypothetical protein DBB_15500 [Desulfoluna spongiiphila]